ncbi:MAG: hypothetical protein EOP83_11585 [Verrucomicrobiaceae bacterium]|nr:MAG: hypothetical protein EOP83_11585 [Verrucomicrobiaceae bacterium]
MPSSSLHAGYPRWGDDLYLVGDVHDDSSQKLIWTCLLMRIYEHERDLDRGRFEGFQRSPCEHMISLSMGNGAAPWAALIGPMINWIAETTTEAWSLDVDIASVGEGVFHFSFAELDVAMMFKLVFG